MRLLVTGGAGFVGAALALAFKRDDPRAEVVALDNLKRRGSELAVPRLAAGGVTFVHGDVRQPSDLEAVGGFDVLIECSAEPSVHAGIGGSPAYVLESNLVGTIHCLEAARRSRAGVVFLSTSRVYPIAPLRALPLDVAGSRLAIGAGRHGAGWSAAGIAESFPLDGPRSLYGATKLASELLITEYASTYAMPAVINRCGVIAGPWQMGKVDQGFLVLWAARHWYRGQLAYSGFGGAGHQVRDVLHVDDLYDLVRCQVAALATHRGRVYNAGGGAARSVSLAELTELCADRAGHRIAIGADPATREADIPWYISDNAAVTAATGWVPSRSIADTVDDVFAWLRRESDRLRPILAA
jgi:CDP-paratose 2-epimerase